MGLSGLGQGGRRRGEEGGVGGLVVGVGGLAVRADVVEQGVGVILQTMEVSDYF
ncbi:hypothetical protein IMZ48_04485 [Candidatus Bathyarchaeota archaeon]|nr:hypothetical protein [Candidatus Bathyarchaeota archaeon]